MENKREEEGKLKSARNGMQRYASAGLTAFLVIANAIIFFLLLYKFKTVVSAVKYLCTILQPILFGFLIAYVLYPVSRFWAVRLQRPMSRLVKNEKKRSSITKGISIFLALLILISVIVVLSVLVIPELYINIRNMVITLPDQIGSLTDQITQFLQKGEGEGGVVRDLAEKILNSVNNWFRTGFMDDMNIVLTRLTAGLISTVNTVFNFVIGMIVSIYVLNEKDKFKRQGKKIIHALFNKKHSERILKTLHKSNELFSGFITGKLVDSLIMGIICFVCLYFLRMPYAVLVSVVIGVTNVIPFFGPFLGAIPSIVLIALTDPMKGIVFILFIIILQQVDGNIIGPKILGESTGLSAFWVVFSILFFGGLFGVPGMLFGVPIFAVIYYMLGVAVNYRLEEKGYDPVDGWDSVCEEDEEKIREMDQTEKKSSGILQNLKKKKTDHSSK